ncbi:hypothetical protein BCR41DRAFT_375570 [Lobosporangium transversale]|uniref:Uncharacterized protein n=1 Tax=Lobosporangium transversale TaxID=64571 RepID=A0A1Y2G6K4_9FUNG|nr:hypothetical protein BCR41DRAFT_375570 [Lobosporangium transversale]ORY98320.1 hypothetical protein BCR41DRAFT_375570 [Lobosporangium transversale]|eukprot:XP_021875731.1 hypothetical protein BCR41DRAFT_375570 [Lobosporangium transversale]
MIRTRKMDEVSGDIRLWYLQSKDVLILILKVFLELLPFKGYKMVEMRFNVKPKCLPFPQKYVKALFHTGHGSFKGDSSESQESCREDSSESEESSSEDSKQPRQSRQNYPFSISTNVVSNKGKLPTCEGCNSQLEREAKRLLVKVPSNVKKGWSVTRSYHFLRACLTKLPQEQYDEAMRQLRVRTTRARHLQRQELIGRQ